MGCLHGNDHVFENDDNSEPVAMIDDTKLKPEATGLLRTIFYRYIDFVIDISNEN